MVYSDLKILERDVQCKLQQHASKDNDLYRQTVILFQRSHDLEFDKFAKILSNLVLAPIDDAVCRELFNKCDLNGNGKIDLYEFMHVLMPAESTKTGISAVLTKEAVKKKRLESNDFYSQPFRGNASELERTIRDCISHKVSRDSDQVVCTETGGGLNSNGHACDVMVLNA